MTSIRRRERRGKASVQSASRIGGGKLCGASQLLGDLVEADALLTVARRLGDRFREDWRLEGLCMKV